MDKSPGYSETVPIQYQNNSAVFMGLDIYVDERVLIPRPETELLVDVSTRLLRKKGTDAPEILDMCTGSGCVAFGLVKLMDKAVVSAVDISAPALQVAENNRKRLGFSGIEFIQSDMFRSLVASDKEKFDCIVSNPPYVTDADYDTLDAWVKAEPSVALCGGAEGMDYLNVLAWKSLDFLKPGGFLAVEVGYDQPRKMKDRLLSFGFERVTAYKDFNGYQRVIVGWKHG